MKTTIDPFTLAMLMAMPLWPRLQRKADKARAKTHASRNPMDYQRMRLAQQKRERIMARNRAIADRVRERLARNYPVTAIFDSLPQLDRQALHA